MATAMSQSKSRVLSVRSTVESIARRLKDVDDMFISFHNMSEHFDQFCDMSERLGLQLRQRYPVPIANSPVPQASTPAELAAIIAATGASASAGASSSVRPKKSEPPPLPPLPPALFEGWVNIIPESDQLAAAASEAESATAKVGFFSGMAKTLKESVAQTDAKLLASVPLAIRKTAKNARFCAMGREGNCKLYGPPPLTTTPLCVLNIALAQVLRRADSGQRKITSSRSDSVVWKCVFPAAARRQQACLQVWGQQRRRDAQTNQNCRYHRPLNVAFHSL
jgi:hypothetical protein